MNSSRGEDIGERCRIVECGEHGAQPATFVCRHVVASLKDVVPRGFWCAQQRPDNPRPDAWCSDCEERVNIAGEWNDETETFAGVTMLCGACYDRVKALNSGA